MKSVVYKLIRVSESEWDNLLLNSSQRNYFVSSEYLRITLRENDKFALSKNDKVVALTVVDEHDSENKCKARYSTYQGIIFVQQDNASYSQVLERIEIQQNLCQLLLDNFSNLHLTLHPSVKDIRGFQFFDFNNDAIRIETSPLYTGVVQLQQFKDFQDYLNNVQANRRQEFRKIVGNQMLIQEQDRKTGDFLQIYRETFLREKILIPLDDLELIERIISESGTKQSTLHFLTDETSNPVATAFVGLQEKTAYYQFAGSLKNSGNASYSSRLLLLLIERLMKNDFASLDLVGLNSPNRSYFKTTFSPEVQVYFDIRIQKC